MRPELGVLMPRPRRRAGTDRRRSLDIHIRTRQMRDMIPEQMSREKPPVEHWLVTPFLDQIVWSRTARRALLTCLHAQSKRPVYRLKSSCMTAQLVPDAYSNRQDES